MALSDPGAGVGQRIYPALSLAESELARGWIRAHTLEYDRIEWNVRLGEGIELGPEFDEETRRAARLNSQKRADFIAYGPGRTAIVEIKDRITHRAIGQLLLYSALWRRENPAGGLPRLIVIGTSIAPDTEPTLEATGITVEIYPPGAP